MDAHAQDPLPLYGLSGGAPIAITYAVRHPERVSQLILLNGYGRTYLSAKQIARDLGLSPRTVEMHVAGAMKALSCTTRAQAVHRATHEGLLAI